MKNEISAQKEKSGDLQKLYSHAHKFVPNELLNLLGKKNFVDASLGDQIELKLTILFTDIRDFTSRSENLTPKETMAFINAYLNRMEPIIINHKGIIDKYIGDAIMAIFPNSADDAVNCSLAMLKELELYNKELEKTGVEPIRIGIGLNTGLCMLGIIGGEHRMESTVISDAVNLASRVESLTKVYGSMLLITENTSNYLFDHNYSMRFIDRVMVKGKIQPQSIYEVYDHESYQVRKLKNRSKIIFEEAMAHYHYKEIDIADKLLKKCIDIYPDDKPAHVYLQRCEKFIKHGHHEGAKELNCEIQWRSDFEVGDKEIDEQHFELFARSYKLIHSVEKELGKKEIDSIFEFLNEYVVKHFETEEKYLEEIKYPFLDYQKMQHENFTKKFLLLKEEISTNKMSKIYLMFRIQVLVIDWIINHTLKEDMHFKKYILKYKNIENPAVVDQISI